MSVGQKLLLVVALFSACLMAAACSAEEPDLVRILVTFADQGTREATQRLELTVVPRKSDSVSSVEEVCVAFLAREVTSEDFRADLISDGSLSLNGAQDQDLFLNLPVSLPTVLFFAEGFPNEREPVGSAACTERKASAPDQSEVVLFLVPCFHPANGPRVCISRDELCGCADGYHCRESTASCVTGEVGSGCDNDQDCDDGNHCVNSSCVRGEPGDPCESDEYCDAGNYCWDTDHICVDGEVNSPCDNDGDCDAENHCWDPDHICVDGEVNSPCDNDGDCDAENHCWDPDHICVDGEVNSPCDHDSDCDAGYYCLRNGDICVNGEVGEPCEDHDDCDSENHCDGDQCKEDFENGEPCGGGGGNERCKTDYCDPVPRVCCEEGADCCGAYDIGCPPGLDCRASDRLCV